MKVINSVLSKVRSAYKSGTNRQLHQFAKILYEQHDVLMVHGKGSTLRDSKGKDYIDMHSMYSAIPVGHANEAFNPIYQDIMDGKLPMTHGAFRKKDTEIAAKIIATNTAQSIGGKPEDYQIYFNNTGAEAVGAADKFAKQHAYKVRGIADEDKISVAMTDNFHGRMIGTSLFDPKKTLSREGFGPHVPNVMHIKWDDPNDVDRFFNENGKNAAYVLLEPNQGEAGIKVPSTEFIQAIVKNSKEHNVPIFADEVQSGLRRTGADNFWASKLFSDVGFKPDIISSAKALGGGEYPVGAVVMTNEIADQIKPGMHGSTFGGNIRAMAFARKTLEILETDELKENIRQREVQLNEELDNMQKDNPDVVVGTTGAGLWRGIVLNPALSTKKVAEKHLENGVVTGESGSKVLRIAPSLTILKEEMQTGTSRLAESFQDISKNIDQYMAEEVSKKSGFARA